MKHFVRLLLVYILTLAFVPCHAGEGCVEEPSSAELSFSEEGMPKNSCAAGPCSPFYACSACHSLTLPASLTLSACLPPPAVRLLCFLPEPALSEFLPAIWQPPQISR